MRYLNKIVFINSADKSLRYAEVNLDGNVHFIGTQGVGKSTLLRAILFFYNADAQKLGISREKQNYNEYYFPYQNSYIIYEVHTEAGKFCVLSFKSQGRVAFRFFNSGYDKSFFIDNEGKAFETWDKTRAALGRIDSTRIVSSYVEYRNILYGNNKGLPAEFRKYALIESRQYQNIPRTITNVFLNAKLDAEFVKETIIKSLTEDEIKIDLTTYSQTHLKDFETNLNDIRKWAEGNLDRQAEKVATVYSALQYLEQKKKELAYQLGYALNRVKEQQPMAQQQLQAEELKRERLNGKLKDLDDVFEKKNSDLHKQIGQVAGKLKELSAKRKEYEAIKIETILQRVSQKSSLELENRNLTDEKSILTSQFIEIQQRYEAQLKQLANQIQEFENTKQTEMNAANAEFLQFKDELNDQYETIYDEIRNQSREALDTAEFNVQKKNGSITDQRIKLSEARHKRFFEAEIEAVKVEITSIRSLIVNAESAILQSAETIKNIQREWEYEEKKLQVETERKVEKEAEKQEKLTGQIHSIRSRIENSKDSLYGWLNEHIPDWKETIGKVIDEENVLFQKGLNPRIISHENPGFYGIDLDTSQISKSVKTVADLQQEQENLEIKLQQSKQSVLQFNVQLNEEQEKLKRKFHPKIKEQKDTIHQNEYSKESNKLKLDEAGVRLSEWETKARTEKASALEKIESEIIKLNEEKAEAEEQVQKLKNSITKAVDARKKEKDAKTKTEQLKLSKLLKRLSKEIEDERRAINRKTERIKISRKSELNSRGADTKRIDEIDLRISEINAELTFIENNRDTVAEFNKDKRELFDREGEFKASESILKKQLETEAEKHVQQKDKLAQQIGIRTREIFSINEMLSVFQKDLEAFESFSKTEVYLTIESYIASYSEAHKTAKHCITLITEIQTTDNTITKRYIELQEAINKFTGNFNENNLFNFKVKFTERAEYFEFAEMLREFTEEDKIAEYKKRLEERFARIIHQIGRETNTLIEKEGEISKIISEINNDFITRNFVGAIKSMELKTTESANRIFRLLVDIKAFNDENIYSIGEPDLFSSDSQAFKNEKAISLLKQLIREMAISKEKEITLSDSFELQFKIVENDNDTGWVEKLSNVGSEGTDVLVKAMINIMLLNVFKEKASKKQKDDFRLHCMMDEVGKLHPNNVKGILKFANDRNILLINSSPTSLNATDYKYTYLLSKDSKNITSIKKLVKVNPKPSSN